MIFWYALGVLLILLTINEIYTLRTGVPTITSFAPVRAAMIEKLRAEMVARPERPFIIYDLGSGYGVLAAEIARALPACQVRGIELSPLPYAASVLRQKILRLPNLAFARCDIHRAAFSEAQAVVLFMEKGVMEKLGQTLQKQLAPGTLVLSNELAFTDWPPPEVMSVGRLKLRVYALYVPSGQVPSGQVPSGRAPSSDGQA